MRDSAGNVLFAYALYYGEAQSLDAEFRAARDGLRFCQVRGLNVSIVETDSQVLAQALNEGSSIPWRVAQLAEEIQALLQFVPAKVSHIVRLRRRLLID